MDKKFNEKITHWNAITNPETATTYYWQEIFPEILKRAKDRSLKLQKKYHCLISLVGFSPEPIVLTVNFLKTSAKKIESIMREAIIRNDFHP